MTYLLDATYNRNVYEYTVFLCFRPSHGDFWAGAGMRCKFEEIDAQAQAFSKAKFEDLWTSPNPGGRYHRSAVAEVLI